MTTTPLEDRPIEDGLPQPRRGWAMVALALTIIMAVTSNILINLALPTATEALGVAPSKTIWLVNAYQIGVLMALLPAAAAGEIWGYKRTYMGGAAVHIVASIALLQADGLLELSLLRTVQGWSSATIMAINVALLRQIYPVQLLGRGISYNATVIAVTGAASPVIAGAILSVVDWQWLFVVNVPIGILALLIGSRTLPANETNGAKFDVPGAMLNALAFGGIFLAVSQLANETFTIVTVPAFLIGAGGTYFLIRRSLTRHSPMLPVDLIRVPMLRSSYLVSFFCFGAQSIALVTLPFYFQGWLGFGEFQTGLMMSPWPASIAFAALIVGRLIERHSAISIGSIALLIFATGLALVGIAPLFHSISLTILGMCFCGIGFGGFQTPNNRTMLLAAPKERSGGAGGMIATVRLIGQISGAITASAVFHFLGPLSPVTLLTASALALMGTLLSYRRRGQDKTPASPQAEKPEEAEAVPPVAEGRAS